MAYTGWFPHFSPSGDHVVTGTGDLYIDHSQAVGFGYLGVPSATHAWFNEHTVLYMSTDAGDAAYGIWSVTVGGRPQKLGITAQFHQLVVAVGRWAGWGAGGIRTSWGTSISTNDVRAPAINSTQLAYLFDGQSAQQRLMLDGVQIDKAPIIDPMMSDEGLVWCRWTNGVRELWGMRLDTPDTPQSVAASATVEYQGIPIDTGSGPWILSYDDGRLLLRPWGDTTGYIVATGETMYPHGVYTSGGKFRIGWSSSTGAYSEALVDPATARVALGGNSSSPVPEETLPGNPGTTTTVEQAQVLYYPPLQHPMTDAKSGLVSRPWSLWFEAVSRASAANPYAYVGDSRLIGRGSAGPGPATTLQAGRGLQIVNTTLSVTLQDILADAIQFDTRVNQPAANEVPIGTLYGVSDEGVIERSNGTTWDTFGS